MPRACPDVSFTDPFSGFLPGLSPLFLDSQCLLLQDEKPCLSMAPLSFLNPTPAAYMSWPMGRSAVNVGGTPDWSLHCAAAPGGALPVVEAFGTAELMLHSLSLRCARAGAAVQGPAGRPDRECGPGAIGV